MSRQKPMGLRHPQPAGRSKLPKRRGSLARDDGAGGGGGAMAAAGEDSIGEREGGRGLKRRQMRARARGREPSSNWVRRSHVPGYIWRARVWGSSRFLAKFRSSDRIRREPPRSRRRRLAGSARLRRRRARGGDAAPRRAVSSSLLGLGSSPSRVRFGCICPCSPAWPRLGFCFSWPIGRDRLRRRPCDAAVIEP